MALTENEKAMALSMQADGKSAREIMGAIASQRTNRRAQPDPFAGVQFSDPTTDVMKGIAKGAGQVIRDTGDLIQSGLPGSGLPVVGPIINRTADAIQNAAGLTDENLAPDNTTETVAKFGTQAASFITPFVAGRLASLTSKGASAAAKVAENSTIAGKAKNAASAATDFLRHPIQRTRMAFAKQNVSDQLEASAGRLYLEGTKRMDDPIAAYESDLAQSKKALQDIKVDPAIASVGEEIGDAFKEVVAKRRAVGATMSDELKKVGSLTTDTNPARAAFAQDLAENNLDFDGKKIIKTARQIKMGAAEVNLLERYAEELNKLAEIPAVSELDAFLARIPSDLDVYKASNNITGVTNAERIIKKSLAELRKQFDPTVSGKPALKAYADARSEYAQLTNFITEGERFLGKLTQSGDYAKDASLAKSSVQSILNQGKKDWLEELEKQTGYPALDRSVIALQAMKDAGDFRGLSLLQQLSDGVAAPTSLPEKIIKYALDKVARAAAGTPEEQTRIFLNALKEAPKK